MTIENVFVKRINSYLFSFFGRAYRIDNRKIFVYFFVIVEAEFVGSPVLQAEVQAMDLIIQLLALEGAWPER